jgi:hypothetical protein
MRHDCRKDNGSHPFGNNVAEQQTERRDSDDQEQLLPELDADVERQQRHEQV